MIEFVDDTTWFSNMLYIQAVASVKVIDYSSTETENNVFESSLDKI